MAFSAQQTIPHPPAAVAEALFSEDFHRSVAESLGGGLVSFARQDQADGGVELTIVRSGPTDRLPDMVRKVVGENLNIEQVERWSAPAADGSRTGTTTIRVPKAKATAEGTLRLAAAPAGTEYGVNGDLQVKIPLVGSKMAQMAEPMVGKVVARAGREVSAWIDRGGRG
ncbi:DUF2505 domain-containing protein [Micrococcus porci]|uniref:DUF2505 domain-containing protein n=1 Tax=Micrococcus TaxID=1269 RepID=UPI001CCC45C6|nr:MULTISPECIES: DUF2505 domain-containing protein [Micrococcus]MCG7421541.1 DUF2505 domain-containing protein [Micrococcus sp. ACRRV]UBH24473.1 DUF2505 domain-containing protein [Micrococcus porci]